MLPGSECTVPSILAWSNHDQRSWWSTAHGIKELDTTNATQEERGMACKTRYRCLFQLDCTVSFCCCNVLQASISPHIAPLHSSSCLPGFQASHGTDFLNNRLLLVFSSAPLCSHLPMPPSSTQKLPTEGPNLTINIEHNSG